MRSALNTTFWTSADAFFAPQPFQHHPHLLFCRLLLPRLSSDLSYPFFGPHFLSHPILLNIVSIYKVSLSFSGDSEPNALTGDTQKLV